MMLMLSSLQEGFQWSIQPFLTNLLLLPPADSLYSVSLIIDSIKVMVPDVLSYSTCLIDVEDRLAT
jgi:hypothetical protein